MEQLARLPEFWQAVFGEGPGYLGLFSGVRPLPGEALTSVHQAYFAYPGAIPQAVRWTEREAEQGRDLYHCAHLLRRARRRAEDAAHLRSLYVDLDAPLPEQPLLLPTLVVESSPNHSQLYYRLTRPVEPRHGAELNRRLAAALGGDPSGWDLTQLLRIPGTHNAKYPERPLVRVVAERAAAYDPRELETFLPHLPAGQAGLPSLPPQRREAPPAPTFTTPEHPADPPVPMTKAALAIWNGQDVKRTPDGRVDRSASLVRLARLLHQAGLSPEHIAAVLAERDEALGWRKFSERDNAAELYRRVVAVVIQGPRTGQRPGG